MKLYKNMLKIAGIAIEKCYSLMNMNGVVFLCNYVVFKRKHELSKIQRKKINFINRLKYAEQKIFCICVDVYKIYDGDDFNELYKVLSVLKN